MVNRVCETLLSNLRIHKLLQLKQSMDEEFYVRRRGWVRAPHGLGTWQENLYDDVLASRTLVDKNYHYDLFVHNMGGTRYVTRIVGSSKDVSLYSAIGRPVNDTLIQRIIDVLGVRTITLVDFDRLPRLDRIGCAGFFDDQKDHAVDCLNDGMLWIVPDIDGYTSVRMPVCNACAESWHAAFNGCPFWPAPVPFIQ